MPHARVKNALPRPDVITAANLHNRCRDCIIDNVAFETRMKLLKPSKIEAYSSNECVSREIIDKEKILSLISGAVSFQSKTERKQTKQKTLKGQVQS